MGCVQITGVADLEDKLKAQASLSSDDQLSNDETAAEEIDNSKAISEVFPVCGNQQVKKQWNHMADWYSSSITQFMSPIYCALIPHLHLTRDQQDGTVFKVLDVAVGDGFNSCRLIKDLIQSKPNGFEYHAVDIAEQMVSKCDERIQNDVLIQTLLKDDALREKFKIVTEVGDGENLEYENESFDRYVSSLCLMLTGNAHQMVQESYRVLKAGGISTWSIWGYQERGVFINCMPNILGRICKEFSIEAGPKPPRDRYYLANNMKQTVRLFKSAGFTTVFYWDMDVAFPACTAKHWFESMVYWPPAAAVLSKLPNVEQKEKAMQMLYTGMNEVFMKEVETGNRAIRHSAICIVAVK